jgi:hypothetical protein
LGLLIFILAGGSQPTHAAVILRGDLNGDGAVSVGDAVVALKLLVQLQPPTANDLAAGDVAPVPGTEGRTVGDGRITVADATRILRYVTHLESAAQFYGGEDPTVDTSGVSLRLNSFQTRSPLFGSAAGEEAPLSLVVNGAEGISMGGVTLSVTPLNGAPPLTLVRVERGGALPVGAEVLASPQPHASGGISLIRAAFALSDDPPINGSGEVLRFILRSDAAVPSTATYQFDLSNGDLATRDAEMIAPASSKIMVSADG